MRTTYSSKFLFRALLLVPEMLAEYYIYDERRSVCLVLRVPVSNLMQNASRPLFYPINTGVFYFIYRNLI